MRRIMQVLAVAAALAAFPALADEDPPLWGFDHDPFSQTFDGRRQDDAGARERERDAKEHRCDRECPCGHGRAQDAAKKA